MGQTQHPPQVTGEPNVGTPFPPSGHKPLPLTDFGRANLRLGRLARKRARRGSKLGWVQHSCKLSPSEAAALDRLAATTARTLDDLIREAVLTHHGIERQPELAVGIRFGESFQDAGQDGGNVLRAPGTAG